MGLGFTFWVTHICGMPLLLLMLIVGSLFINAVGDMAETWFIAPFVITAAKSIFVIAIGLLLIAQPLASWVAIWNAATKTNTAWGTLTKAYVILSGIAIFIVGIGKLTGNL